MPKERLVPTGIYLDKDVLNLMEVFCRQMGVSRNRLVRVAVQSYLEEQLNHGLVRKVMEARDVVLTNPHPTRLIG